MTTLYLRNETSDKVYFVNLVPNGEKYDVEYAYGRRGSTMTTGKKNTSPESLADANIIMGKLIHEKMSKGYTPGADGAAYTNSDKEDRFTGILPMLLNAIEEEQVDFYLNSNDWVAQEKHDGRRMMVRKDPQYVVDAINRKGLIVGAPERIIHAAGELSGAFILDGECVGETYHAFDDINLSLPYWRRLEILHERVNLSSHMPIIEIATARSTGEKTRLLGDLRMKNAEGIVFKHLNALYVPGRPNSGGDAIKFKFYAAASVMVSKVNTQRSVAIQVMSGFKWTNCGNVTIPSNKAIPSPYDIIEVRYLYAYKGSGILYQPVYLGKRGDLDNSACDIQQLKFKEGSEEDEP